MSNKLGRISGTMLQSNLDVQGTNLTFASSNVAILSLDAINNRVGIANTSPTERFTVNGSVSAGNILINATTDVITTRGNSTLVIGNGKNVSLGDIANIKISGGSLNHVVSTDGSGNLTWANVSSITSGLIGNGIILGSNTAGQLVSNAVSLTTVTNVTNSIALLNQVLGKLVPPSPPAFPAGQTLTISGLTNFGRMTNFTQTDNTASQGKNVSGGTSVPNVLRTASYGTNTITNVGPGDSGLVSALLNGISAGSVTLTGASNGTYGNLIISNNQDYNNVLPNVAAGFWSSFSSRASGTVRSGWNEVQLTDSATGTPTNTPSWYYDSATPGVPLFSATSFAPSANLVSYSSTIPHYNSSAQFSINFNINRLSGDLYPSTDTFVTGSAGGAFAAPLSKTYAQVGITTPLIQNLFVTSGSVPVSTTVNITTGFGSSATGPGISVINSYSTGTQAFSPGATVLYKTGTATNIEETSIPVSVGIGSGNGARIVNQGSGVDTPSFTPSATPFNSISSTLTALESTVVGAILKHDTTNYSTGFLPVGPDLSTGRSAAQYFTFKFIRTVVSKFDINYTGTIAGLWVSLPGSSIDNTSSINGWLNLNLPYAGIGIPGANVGNGGNGSNGAALGAVAALNSAGTRAVTATFGTVSSSSTATNEIYVRIKLTAGQTVSALSIGAATN